MLSAKREGQLHPKPCRLVSLKQRPGPERVGEGVHATGQGQRVR